jgi:hypothetical protein
MGPGPASAFCYEGAVQGGLIALICYSAWHLYGVRKHRRAIYDSPMGLLAHGGTAGLVLETLPALVLAGLGVGIWLRGRRRASAAPGPGDEAGVEEGRGEGE